MTYKNFKQSIKDKQIIILTLLIIFIISTILYGVYKFNFKEIIPIIISSMSTIPIINDIFKTLKLDIYLAKQKPLTLNFNRGGSYLNLKIAIHSINKPCIITDIKINLINNTTNDEFEFEWGYFKEPSNAWTSNNENISTNILNVASFTRPIEINANSTRAYDIEFYSPKLKNLEGSYEKLKKFIIEKINDLMQKNNFETIQDSIIITEIKNDAKIEKIIEEEITPLNIWKNGKYTISIETTYNKTKSLIHKYNFEISNDQCIKLNGEYILGLVINELKKSHITTKNIEINELIPIDN